MAQLLLLGVMDTPPKLPAPRFLKIYGVVMAMDLMVYLLIFYAGRAIPPRPDTSFPGNFGLCVWWTLAHYPAAWLYYHKQMLPDGLLWVLIFQDALWAGLILLLVALWKRVSTR